MEGHVLVLAILTATLSVLGSVHALPLKPLFLSQLTEREGELYLGDQDTELSALDTSDLVEKLQYHADTITANTQEQIESAQEFPPMDEGRQREKRSAEDTVTLLHELQSVFYDLIEINRTATFPVAYPSDVEAIYYNDDFYIMVTGAADPDTSSTADTIYVYYYDVETNSSELVVQQDTPSVHDVDWFSFDGDYYVVATQWSDDQSSSEGCISIFLWNVAASRGSQRFERIQLVKAQSPRYVKTLMAGGTQFIITSEIYHASMQEAAVMYEWKGGHIDEFGSFPKSNISSIVPFCIHSEVYVGLASKADEDGNYITKSDILLYNLHLHQFELLQKITTYGAIDMAIFLLGYGMDTEAFLLIANEHSEKGSAPRSVIYKYNDDRFEPFQCLEVPHILGWHVIKQDHHFATMIIYTADDIRFYEYDGWVFQETIVQFQPADVVLPVVAISSQYNGVDNTADLVVASALPSGRVCTHFMLKLTPLSLAGRFDEEAVDQCEVETEIYKVILTKHVEIVTRVDQVVFKDIGEFVYNGNMTFLGNVSAGDAVIRELVVGDGPLLTKREEKQLARIRRIVASNTAALIALEIELPNTMLVNTSSQGVAGLKTFSSITAEGDLSSGTLSVISNIVNGDIDLQELSDYYIDRATRRVLNNSLILAGGVDILGYLNVTGLLDGVDMADVVTLSRDHTITGAKTFDAPFTAQQNLNVSGTVDGVNLRSDSVLMTSGNQTVSGALTFGGGLTAEADVSVTGDVDTVDLSTLKDEAFYLNRDNVVTGGLTFAKPVTMDKGLNMANGSKIDGVDIPDISNILRKSVEQNVTAKYTFTETVTIDADIMVEGLVDNLHIPSDIVLIDDPNPVDVVGPLKFHAELNVSCLYIRDKINKIRVLGAYANLDLLLIAPKTSKNKQRLLGKVDFETDITVTGNSSLTGRIDGVTLEDMQDDTVYITGSQRISGTKTFSGDVTIGGDLTVGQLINNVDINDLDDNTVKLSEGVISTLGVLELNGDVVFQDAVATNGLHTFGDTLTLSDLVTQRTTETIGGAKTFVSITSEGDVWVTSNVNGVPVDRLYSDSVRLDDTSAVTVTASWDFDDDVHVQGDLLVTGNIDGIDLDDAVTVHGDQTITGPTTFADVLCATVNISVAGDLALSDGTVNGFDVQDVNQDTLKCSGAQRVTGRKTFDTLNVTDNVVITGTVRGVDISDIYDDAVFITGNQGIAGVKTFRAETTFQNMVFNDLVDGIRVPEFFDEVLTQGTTQTVLGHLRTANLLVEGNITLSDTVNGLVIEDMWEYSAKMTDSSYTVEITFTEVESEDDVSTYGTVDGIVISRDVALANATDQVFTGEKTFSMPPLFKGDIAVVIVNEVDILDLWDRTVKNVGDQDISATKTFSAGITVNGNITVTGTVDGVDVSDLASRAVLTSSDKTGAVQTITADVTFTDVRALQDINYAGTLQRVNIQTLDSSYVSRSASDQTITADKTFSGPVTVVSGGTLDVDSLDLDGTFNTWDMDTQYEEAWINGGNAIVYDIKTFEQCVIMEDDLTVDGLVDGVDISNNAMTINQNQQVSGFKIFSSRLLVNKNLNFETGNQIDGVDVSDWDLNAARKGSSYAIKVDLTFENMDFQDSVTVSGTCNDLDFSPATFMTKSRDQDVTAVKTFKYGVEFTGNMDVTGMVQGADVEEIETTSLLTSSDQTLQGSFVFETTPTFANITTTGLIDGEDVVELYLRTHNIPDLDGFEDFVGDQCNLLEDMHEAFESQAYILRYPELVQTFRTSGRAKWKAFYFESLGIQLLMLARTQVHIDAQDDLCINSFIYSWEDLENKYKLFRILTLDFAEDVVFFEEEGYLFLAVITSNYTKDCEIINFLPNAAEPIRDPDFELDVVPSVFHGISDFIVLVYVWAPELNNFHAYQRLSGVGSVSVDHYVDPLLNKSCLAVANHRSMIDGNITTEVQSAVYCMESVAKGFTHHAVIDTLGAVEIFPFIYDDVLHLVAANRLDTAQRTFMVESTIWGNFVKEVVITTSAVSDVTVHQFHGHYFVAFANEFEGQLEWEDYDVPISVYTYVYNPDGESTVSLIQEIPAYRVQSLEFMEIYDQLFLVVVNRTNSITIFRYKGMELFKVIHTIPLEGAANLAIYPFKNDRENLHIAATGYMERSAVVAGSPIRSRPVDSVILSLFFQGFDTDTVGCSSPYS